MKKVITCGIFLLCLSVSNAWAESERQTEVSPPKRALTVLGRGAVNLVTLPAEIPLTFVREREMHSRLWPVTGIPRMINNVIVRATSAVNDATVFPFVSLFTDDTRPWSEPMGLPEYSWQTE